MLRSQWSRIIPLGVISVLSRTCFPENIRKVFVFNRPPPPPPLGNSGFGLFFPLKVFTFWLSPLESPINILCERVWIFSGATCYMYI